MKEQFSRSRMLLGEEAMNRLKSSRVAVFGVGGVGGFVVEALARSGVGTIDIIDNDTVVLSNLNRQIIATMDTVGRDKVEVMKERIQSINPAAVVNAYKCFFLPETAGQFDFTAYDYVVDAIDTVTGKIQLVVQAKEAGVPVISAMGAGNKLDPTRFEVADIYSTSIDPLARVMRRELKKRGIESLKVVYSKEKPIQPMAEETAYPDSDQTDHGIGGLRSCEGCEEGKTVGTIGKSGLGEDDSAKSPQGTEGVTGPGNRKPRRATPGSLAFVPSVAGLIIAGEVIKDLSGFGA